MNTNDSARDFLQEHLREVPPFRALLRSVECDLLIREAASLFEEPLLDLGCGDGHFAASVFDLPVSAGMDPDLKILLEAKKRRIHRFRVAGSGASMPWSDDAFATVVANSVLEHVQELDTTLSEVNRILKNRGTLVLTVPSERFGELLFGATWFRALHLSWMADAYARWFNRISRHFHTDSADVWRSRLETHGFEVVTCEPYFGPKSHRVFDLAHYLSSPCLVSRKLTGKWIRFPNSFLQRVWLKILRPYCDSRFQREGAYLFLLARKRGRRGDS